MKYMLPFFITGSMLLSACAGSAPSAQHGGLGGGHTQGSADQKANLTVQDQSTDSEIAFAIRDGNEIFMDYGVSHTKEMHLIVVRDDLQHFQHLHPERDDNGVWRVPFTAYAGGDYWIYADFVSTDQSPSTIRFERTFAGNPGEQGIAESFEQVKMVDGYRIKMESETTDGEVTFTYDITDSRGQTPKLEEYLGAKGHSVLISPSGDFIHTHASEEGVIPEFKTAFPPDSFYRAFTQFQINGEIVTVNFDWAAPQE